MIISESASIPIVTASSGTPSSSSTWPKVRRGVPLSRSRPTVARRTSQTPAASPRSRELPANAAMSVNANSMIVVISMGPMRSAKSASGLASMISASVPTTSPKTEP